MFGRPVRAEPCLRCPLKPSCAFWPCPLACRPLHPAALHSAARHSRPQPAARTRRHRCPARAPARAPARCTACWPHAAAPGCRQRHHSLLFVWRRPVRQRRGHGAQPRRSQRHCQVGKVPLAFCCAALASGALAGARGVPSWFLLTHGSAMHTAKLQGHSRGARLGGSGPPRALPRCALLGPGQERTCHCMSEPLRAGCDAACLHQWLPVPLLPFPPSSAGGMERGDSRLGASAPRLRRGAAHRAVQVSQLEGAVPVLAAAGCISRGVD